MEFRATGSVLEGQEVKTILRYLKEQNADLLVIGLHQHDFYLSRLWSSVYDLAQEASCSVLGVHRAPVKSGKTFHSKLIQAPEALRHE